MKGGQDVAFEQELVRQLRAARLERGTGVWFDGGDGESADDPILIRGLESGEDLERAERYWLVLWFGPERQSWAWGGRAVVSGTSGAVERVTVHGFDGTRLERYFTADARE